MARTRKLNFIRGTLAGLAIALLLSVLFSPTPLLAQASRFGTLTLAPGFQPNPVEVRGQAGGPVAATALTQRTDTATGRCAGFVDRLPNHVLVLRAFFNALTLEVRSSEDTALIVQGPGGTWCNDDQSKQNPGISGQWLPGTYRIWVNSYARDRSPNYVLRLRER